MATPVVGGEIDAFCTKCEMTLAHTIVAMVGSKVVRVQCNTCRGAHAFRAGPGASQPAAKRASSGASRVSREEKVIISWEQRLGGKDVAKARTYSPKESFALDELVKHPTFGLGIVSAVRGDKIDIDFKAQQKTLVHGRGESGGAKPTFSHPPRPGTSAVSGEEAEAAAPAAPDAEG